jgi:L-ascorbate metabolism protein UlaG (beta-lactamase superfamily)
MELQLLRHATMLLNIGDKKILIDPVLSPSEATDPIPTKKEGQGRRNPLVDLPLTPEELKAMLNTVDAALITHMHRDHFDDVEGKMLPHSLPLLCQPEDESSLKEIGFDQVIPIQESLFWNGLHITRTDCQHGGAYWKKKMGIGSGYIIQASGEPKVYITGDTIWFPPVKETLLDHNPDIVIAYAGAAQFPTGRSITMNKRDIDQVCRYAPKARIVAVHMEAINHCLLTRDKLRQHAVDRKYANRLLIPKDGECLRFKR